MSTRSRADAEISVIPRIIPIRPREGGCHAQRECHDAFMKSAQMTKIVIPSAGSYDRLEIQTFDVPEPADDEILIEVRAAGVNYADVIVTTNSRSVMAFNLSYLFDRTDMLELFVADLQTWLDDESVVAPPVTTYALADVAQAHRVGSDRRQTRSRSVSSASARLMRSYSPWDKVCPRNQGLDGCRRADRA